MGNNDQKPTDGHFRVNQRASKIPSDLVEEERYLFPVNFPEATENLLKILPLVKKHEAIRRSINRIMSIINMSGAQVYFNLLDRLDSTENFLVIV